MDKWWGFEKGDLVDIVIYDIDNPMKKIRTVKKLSRTGNSTSIFLDRPWGFSVNDVVVLRLEKHGYDYDAGSEAEKGDQGLS